MLADTWTIGLILFLIFVNGLFAMSEMSIVSSRKSRLLKLMAERRYGAKTALKLHDNPSRFLSTVQVGITSVGILIGAMSEETLAKPLYQQLSQISVIAPYAETIALALTVFSITYFSVVLGELVPKNLALLHPESIALVIARPMNWLSVIASPFVWLLSASTNLLLSITRIHRHHQTSVTDEEIKILMDIGSEAGTFHISESRMVVNVLKLDEQRIGAIMTPRSEIFAINLAEDDSEVRKKIAHSPYSRVVVCRGGLENVIGILHCSDLLKMLLKGSELKIEKELRAPLYVHESMTLMHLLAHFREANADFALIVNEYGDLEGLVTLNDVLSAIVGDLSSGVADIDMEVIQRDDGSWLVDGGLSITRLKSVIGMSGYFPDESDNIYNTVAGLMLHHLESIPHVADHFEYDNWRFEVVDIDGTRIDKVLITNKF